MINIITSLLVKVISPLCWSPNLEGLKMTGISNEEFGFITICTNKLMHTLWNIHVYLFDILCQVEVMWICSSNVYSDWIGVGIDQSDRTGYRTV